MYTKNGSTLKTNYYKGHVAVYLKRFLSTCVFLICYEKHKPSVKIFVNYTREILKYVSQKKVKLKLFYQYQCLIGNQNQILHQICTRSRKSRHDIKPLKRIRIKPCNIKLSCVERPAKPAN